MEKIIGEYRITKRKIGEGSFGTVYIGLDTQNNNQEVAVKIIEHSKLEGSALDYFYSEILALKNCCNEHIVKFYDIKKTQHYFYLFIEYCNEGDLNDYIKKRGRLSEEEALELLFQIIKGFRTIVKSKLIHRDLKPANIFIKDGKVKIGDFGLARILSEKDMASTFAGSPYNMAPEVLKHEQYDNRADIYGIGTVFYEMLFGGPPFKANTISDLLNEINAKHYRKFDKSHISNETYNLLNRMLRAEPEKRITWEELFGYQAKRLEKKKAALYSKYEDFTNHISTDKMNAIPSIFCLLNLNDYGNFSTLSNKSLSNDSMNSKGARFKSSLSKTSSGNSNNNNNSNMAAMKKEEEEQEQQAAGILRKLDLELGTRLFVKLVTHTELQQ